MHPKDPSDVISRTCEALTRGDIASAAENMRNEYPFAPKPVTPRHYTKQKRLEIFLRDGFVDRYTGQHLVFHPVLAIISHQLPEDFPAHPNWKITASHLAYWELSPTIDHVQPIARGGTNDDENMVTCSQISNTRKSVFTLVELGWDLHPCGSPEEWDGLLKWFMEYVGQHPKILDQRFRAGEIKSWHRAALKLLGTDLAL